MYSMFKCGAQERSILGGRGGYVGKWRRPQNPVESRVHGPQAELRGPVECTAVAADAL